MKRFTFITSIVFASILMLFVIPATAQEIEEEPISNPQLKIYSGFVGGSYYQMSVDMQKMTRKMGYGTVDYNILTTELPKIDPATGDTLKNDDGTVVNDVIVKKIPTGDTTDFLEVRESDGSYYNFLKINKIDVNITFLQYDVLLYEDIKDLGRKFKKTENIRILLPMGSEEIHIITLKENKIENFGDLKKKRVGIGSSLQGTNITAKYIKEITGAKWTEVDIPYDKAFRALFSHDIDAFFFVGSAPIYDLKTLPKSMKDKLLLIGIPADDKLKDAYGEQVEINTSTYSWVIAPVKTYAVKSLLVTSLSGHNDNDPNDTQREAITKLLTAIKKMKDTEGYHEAWKDVHFTKDPVIEWKYYTAALKLYE
ncbi:MAG: hypothetical protein DRI84_04530 [Bacteroidetes bacterium]|nr:MAG: hypothetical protein DRI84_04530 [Bacteroidota bacterium]